MRKLLEEYVLVGVAERYSWISILHSLAATGPVAVVKVDALALEDEGADAVLFGELA